MMVDDVSVMVRVGVSLTAVSLSDKQQSLSPASATDEDEDKVACIVTSLNTNGLCCECVLSTSAGNQF